MKATGIVRRIDELGNINIPEGTLIDIELLRNYLMKGKREIM